MSGLVMGLVFEMPINDSFGRPEKFILLAYADHADQNGKNIYPSVDLIAAKTGYRERAIQQITRNLELLGCLVPDGQGPHGTNRWGIPLERTPDGGAKIAPHPVSINAPEEIAPLPMSKNAPEGNAPEGNAPKPSVVVKDLIVVINADFAKISEAYEQEFGGLTPMIADAIRDAVDHYPPDWIPEAMKIAVAGNKRNWKYVEGILKNCKAKNVRPSLNKLEKPNGNHSTGNQQRDKRSKPGKPNTTVEYNQADMDAAARINARV